MKCLGPFLFVLFLLAGMNLKSGEDRKKRKEKATSLEGLKNSMKFEFLKVRNVQKRACHDDKLFVY